MAALEILEGNRRGRESGTGVREKIIVTLTGRHLIRGGMFQVAGYLLCAGLLPLILTPVILNALGAGTYGIWAVLVNAGMWVLFLDAGIALGLPKVAGEIAVGGKPDDIWSLISSVLTVWLAIFLAVTAAAWASSAFLYETLTASAATSTDRMIVTLVAVNFVFLLGTRFLTAVLNGLQWVAATAKVFMLVNAAYFVAVFAAMKSGGGLFALAVISCASQGMNLVLLLAILHRSVPWTDRFRLDGSILRAVVSVGGVLFLVQLLAQVFQLDRIYFSILRIPMDRIAEYHLGLTLAAKISGLLAAMTAAIVPAASAFASLQDADRLRELTLRGTKYLSTAGFLLFGFLAAFTPEIVMLWLGREMPAAVSAARILSLWGLTAVIGGLTAVGAGLGRPGFQLKSSFLALLIAAPVFWFWGRRYGMSGVAWTISLSVFSVAVYYIYDFCRSVLPGTGRILVMQSFGKPLCLGLCVLPACVVVELLKSATDFGTTRSGCLALLLAAAVITAAGLMPLAKFLRVFDEKDRDRLLGFFAGSAPESPARKV